MRNRVDIRRRADGMGVCVEVGTAQRLGKLGHNTVRPRILLQPVLQKTGRGGEVPAARKGGRLLDEPFDPFLVPLQVNPQNRVRRRVEDRAQQRKLRDIRGRSVTLPLRDGAGGDPEIRRKLLLRDVPLAAQLFYRFSDRHTLRHILLLRC